MQRRLPLRNVNKSQLYPFSVIKILNKTHAHDGTIRMSEQQQQQQQEQVGNLESVLIEIGGEWDLVLDCEECDDISHIDFITNRNLSATIQKMKKVEIAVQMEVKIPQVEDDPLVLDDFPNYAKQRIVDLARQLSESLRVHYRPDVAHVVVLEKQPFRVHSNRPDRQPIMVITATMEYRIAYTPKSPDRAKLVHAIWWYAPINRKEVNAVEF